jgi:hypothetical protein
MSSGDRVVLLRSFSYRHEGELARNTLAAAGIESALMVDDAGGAHVGLSFSNPARLLVREADLEAATEVLEESGLVEWGLPQPLVDSERFTKRREGRISPCFS